MDTVANIARFDDPSSGLEYLLGDAARSPAVMAALADAHAELRALADEQNARQVSQWTPAVLEVAAWPDSAERCAEVWGYVEGGGDNHVCFWIELNGRLPQDASANVQGAWLVRASVQVIPDGPNYGSQTAFDVPDQFFATPADAARGLAVAARQLREVARTRAPTAAAWRELLP
jgi:hypothetical protein